MRIGYTSDLHNEFRDIPLVLPEGLDLLVLAGDIHKAGRNIEYAAQYLNHCPVVVVAGNHEHYNGLKTMIPVTVDHGISIMKRRAKELGVHYLENDTVEIAGKKISGATLWTDYAIFDDERWSMQVAESFMNDYRCIFKYNDDGYYPPVTADDILKFHNFSRTYLENSNADVFVTHHAPSICSAGGHAADRLTPAYCSNLEYIMKDRKILWIHGHTHYNVNYHIYESLVVSNPRGYPGELPGEFAVQVVEI